MNGWTQQAKQATEGDASMRGARTPGRLGPAAICLDDGGRVYI